jgi:hypothetical protein
VRAISSFRDSGLDDQCGWRRRKHGQHAEYAAESSYINQNLQEITYEKTLNYESNIK